MSGPSNLVADALSQDFELTWEELMARLEHHLPPGSGYQVWEPSPKFAEAIFAALTRKRQSVEAILVSPPEVQQESSVYSLDPLEWPSMPTCKPASVSYGTYTKADDEFVRGNHQTYRIPSGLDRLKVTYGRLARWPDVWGPAECSSSNSINNNTTGLRQRSYTSTGGARTTIPRHRPHTSTDNKIRL